MTSDKQFFRFLLLWFLFFNSILEVISQQIAAAVYNLLHGPERSQLITIFLNKLAYLNDAQTIHTSPLSSFIPMIGSGAFGWSTLAFCLRLPGPSQSPHSSHPASHGPWYRLSHHRFVYCDCHRFRWCDPSDGCLSSFWTVTWLRGPG